MRIRSDADYRQALDEIDKLLEAEGDNLASDQDRLRARELLDATAIYEDRLRRVGAPDRDPPPIDW